MYNIDGTQLEGPWGEQENDYESIYQGEAFGPYGSFGEYEPETGMDEAEVMELADELLSVGNDMEMDLFLGNLFKTVSKSLGRVGRNANRFLRSPQAKMIAQTVRSAARQALPIAAQAAGPALGAALTATGYGAPFAPAATALAPGAINALGSMFGLELEGLSAEDQEFNLASQLVRFAQDATRKVLTAPPGMAPQQAVQRAVTSAAQKYAPGLLSAGQQVIGNLPIAGATHRCPRCGFVHPR
jgi:hypothetical protein